MGTAVPTLGMWGRTEGNKYGRTGTSTTAVPVYDGLFETTGYFKRGSAPAGGIFRG
jgi:hypothetical protein